MKTTLVKNLFMILSLAALAACSGPPSVGDIKEQLVSVVVGNAGGIATVENFEKINGHEKDEKTYIADVKYDLVFSNDAQGMLQQAIKESPPAALAAMGSQGLALAAFGPAMMNLVAGKTFSIQDEVTFIETEKGWVLKEWHPEALGNAMGESLLEKMATALLSSREPAAGSAAQGDPKLAARGEGSEHTNAKVETQQDTLASQEAEMKRVMEENAKLKAENQEAKRTLEEQQASVQKPGDWTMFVFGNSATTWYIDVNSIQKRTGSLHTYAMLTTNVPGIESRGNYNHIETFKTVNCNSKQIGTTQTVYFDKDLNKIGTDQEPTTDGLGVVPGMAPADPNSTDEYEIEFVCDPSARANYNNKLPAEAAAKLSQPEGAPSISLGKVPNKQTDDFHNAAANPFVAEMITAALANDNRRIIEIRDQLLSQPKPQRGDRKRARALNDEALSYLNTQQPDKAVASLQLATKMDPGDIEIINNLGYALLKTGQLEESEHALAATLVIAPDRTSAWANLGHVYAMTGKKEEAVACFTNAYRFSQNTEKTKNVFTNLSQNHENQNVRQALAEALRAM